MANDEVWTWVCGPELPNFWEKYLESFECSGSMFIVLPTIPISFDNFEVKKLVPKIVCPNIGLYHECLYGFLYDGKEVEVEFTGDTVGKTRTFYLIEPTYDDDNGQITYDIADEWYM